MNPEAGRLGLPDAENQDSWLLKLCNRLKMVVFDSMGLFAGILRPRDTCNDPISSIDLVWHDLDDQRSLYKGHDLGFLIAHSFGTSQLFAWRFLELKAHP